MPKRKEKAEAQNKTNQRVTKKRQKMQNNRVQLLKAVPVRVSRALEKLCNILNSCKRALEKLRNLNFFLFYKYLI
jgi:hypothetical protein